MRILRCLFVVTVICMIFLISEEKVIAQDDLEKSAVTSHMEEPILKGSNLVYCSTFQIAWTGLRDDIIKEDIRAKKPVDIIPYLNKGLSTEADISARDYLAMAGFVSDGIVGKINMGLKSKFGFDAMLLDEAKYADPDIILAYAFLNKNLEFENPFEDYKQPMTFYTKNGNEEVESFGVHKYSSKPEHLKIRRQVDILDYVDYRNFIIRLNSVSTDDEIILAKVTPEKNLLETFKKVDSKVSKSRPVYLEKNDILQIPKFNLSLLHSYSSLLGVYLVNKGFEGYFFDEATQRINFRLDEYGAKVKSDAIIVLKKGLPIDFKILIFNSPFLLYIKKKDGTYPYLAIWIENTELLVKSQFNGEFIPQ